MTLRLIASHLQKFLGRRAGLLLPPALSRFALRVVELLLVSSLIELAMSLPMAIYFHRITAMGLPANLLVVPHDQWLPRRRALQPIFTKHHVPQFAGHMADIAEQVARDWAGGATVDLDADCRALTLRALALSILGIDLGDRTEVVADALRTGVYSRTLTFTLSTTMP